MICAHGQLELTLRCLESITAFPPQVAYEVIVVDDASADETAEVLGLVRHLKLVTNQVNLGFLRSANRGAAESRGEYIVMLNNDTEVTAEWLDALVGTADERSDVGVVGCRLVYPDRRLQEAGGIVWSDGHGWNYGRGQSPDSGSYSFVREVDYCSGAALLIRRALWDELGGFDPAFAPAYYEDTDLCFRARARGWKVVYQPRATVFHVEGASHGTDTAHGGKAHQADHHEVFVRRWSVELAEQQDNDARRVMRARDRRSGPRILVVDDRVPTPDEDSGSVRMWHLLEILDELGCVVTLLPADGLLRQPWLDRLQQRGVEVLYGPIDPADYLTAMGPDLGAVILSRPANALRYLSLVRELSPHAVVVYDTVDLHFLRLQREAQVHTGAATSRLGATMRSLELAVASDADITLAVSEAERQVLLEAEAGADVVVVSNIHPPLPLPPGVHGRAGLLLVGNFQHPPNIDAAMVMVREVMPLVWAHRPDTVLRIVGSRMSAEIQDLAAPGIDVLGWLPDLTEVHDTSRLLVAPLRFGAGVKGKVGDALRRGLPVVTSTIGAEGMDLIDGVHALIADGPVATAQAVLTLLEDDDLWWRLCRAGVEHVSRRLSAAAASRALEAAFRKYGVLTA